MKKQFIIILLILLFPLYALGNIIMGGNTNTSKPYPIVTTNAATSIASTSATLNGSAYNYNSAGTSYFNYGTTSAYGSQTSQVVFTANVVTTSFSAVVSGLTPGTLYHFQACVSNATGLSCGSDLTFTTFAHFAEIATLSLSGVGSTLTCGVLDITNNFLYAGSYTGGSAGVLTKVDVSTMSQGASVTMLDVNEGNQSCAIDTTSNFIYLGSALTNSAPKIVKVNASPSNFSRVGRLNYADGGGGSSLVGPKWDSTKGVVYFGVKYNQTTTPSLQIATVTTSSFTQTMVDVGVALGAGYNAANGTSIDMPNSKIFVFTGQSGGSSGGVYGTTSTGSPISGLTGFSTTATGTSIISSDIDQPNQVIYNVSSAASAVIRRISIPTMSILSSLTLNSGETNGVTTQEFVIVLDQPNQIAYFVTNQNPPKVIKINVATTPPTRVSALTLSGSAPSGGVWIILDQANQLLYVGTSSPPRIVKIAL